MTNDEKQLLNHILRGFTQQLDILAEGLSPSDFSDYNNISRYLFVYIENLTS